MDTHLQTAIAAAEAGGVVLSSRVGDLGAVRSKGSPTDFVTEVDIASGVATALAIAERLPGARFVIEEDEVYDLAGVTRGSLCDEEVWVIDPLDGTTSYLHGFPCYSVAVALLRDGVAVTGAVHNAALSETFSATLGGGAHVDGRAVSASAASSVPEALLVTGFPYDRGAPLDRQLAILAAFLRAPVHGIRRDGSAAIDCCHVASGRADGFWEFGLKPWDMAAGAVICAEAGCVVTDASGALWTPECGSICVANPTLHAGMLKVIASV